MSVNISISELRSIIVRINVLPASPTPEQRSCRDAAHDGGGVGHHVAQLGEGEGEAQAVEGEQRVGERRGCKRRLCDCCGGRAGRSGTAAPYRASRGVALAEVGQHGAHVAARALLLLLLPPLQHAPQLVSHSHRLPHRAVPLLGCVSLPIIIHGGLVDEQHAGGAAAAATVQLGVSRCGCSARGRLAEARTRSRVPRIHQHQRTPPRCAGAAAG